MMVPIRCWTCGTPIGHLWEEYQERAKKEDKKKVLDSFQLKRYCCRTQLMGHVDLIDTVSKFKKV
jgi:DNA-directed RNA polymerase subunit N